MDVDYQLTGSDRLDGSDVTRPCLLSALDIFPALKGKDSRALEYCGSQLTCSLGAKRPSPLRPSLVDTNGVLHTEAVSSSSDRLVAETRDSINKARETKEVTHSCAPPANCPSIPSINNPKVQRDAYIVVAFFCTISVIGLPVGVFLAYRALQIHRSLPNGDGDNK
jgi:hypothetical protein